MGGRKSSKWLDIVRGNPWKRFGDNFENIFSKARYVSHFEAERLKERYPKFRVSPLQILLLVNPFRVRSLLNARRAVATIEERRTEHNEAFIRAELPKSQRFFDKVTGLRLDEQQRRAILTDEDNMLVIAGAGSGKTTTIVGKAQYLIKKLKIRPDHMLIISFTKKSANELAERINVAGVDPQTFHKFGLEVLREAGDQSKIYDGQKLLNLMERLLREETKDKKYLEQLTTWFLNYQKIPASQFEFATLGEYIQYLKDQGYQSYRRVPVPYQGRKTYRREIVRSIEECIIANFLLFNRVPYSYEVPYRQTDTSRKYEPDFTIEQAGRKVYLEHFAVDQKGNVPPFFAKPHESPEDASQRYTSEMKWKRSLHARNKTELIESYSYEFSEGTLADNLRRKLEAADVRLDPMTPEEMWQEIRKSAQDEVASFVELVSTFLTLLKSNQQTLQAVRKRSRSFKTSFEKERLKHFLRLFEPLLKQYEEFLQREGMMDFSDMINRATQILNAKAVTRRVRYVIIDEFQDLSTSRYSLLQALRKQNREAKFFCVGDDWQSIFRFAGSDLGLFRNFESHFGYTKLAKIETTYRFNEPMIGVSGGFVMKNPNQIRKKLKAPEGTEEVTHTVVEAMGEDETEAVSRIFAGMAKADASPSHEVMLIGRYNSDFDRIKNTQGRLTVNADSKKVTYEIAQGKHRGKKYVANFVTAHRAKGLQADVVIVLNCNAGSFPSERADDPLLTLLLSRADAFEHGEERRLFYVAMTRAKKKTYFVTNTNRKSSFIKEMESKGHSSPRRRACPQCTTGEIVERPVSTNDSPFFGCTNYPYCKYTTKRPARTLA